MDNKESVRFIKFRKHGTRREKCLFAAVAVFVIVAILFIVLYAKQVSKNGETASSGSTAANEGATNDTTNKWAYCTLRSEMGRNENEVGKSTLCEMPESAFLRNENLTKEKINH